MWPETKSVYTALLSLKPVGNYKGFWLLISVVEEILKQKNLNYNLSRDIYPVVAQKFDCNSGSIERNIRTLLLNIDMATLDRFTSTNIPKNITVSQLIDILVVHLFSADLKAYMK